MVLVCHVTLQYHVIKGLFNFMNHGQEPIMLSFDPAKFDGYRHPGNGDMVVVVIGVLEIVHKFLYQF